MSSLQPLTLSGLIAAVFTPMKPDGALDLGVVPAVTDFVLGQGVDGLFVCGSTGEGPSLSREERMAVTDAYVSASSNRAPVIAHVGHNCLADARALAAHASRIGVDAIAIAPPSYFRPQGLDVLIECLVKVAEAAPTTPLYYYHIPRITGVNIRVFELLEQAEDQLPTLRGVKFSSFEQDDLIRTIDAGGGRYNILFGSDEMLLAGLSTGAAGAVGSTFNFLGPYYRRVMAALEAGDLPGARARQAEVTRIVHAIIGFGGHNAIKAAMNQLGVDCGPPRLPVKALSVGDVQDLGDLLDEVLMSQSEGLED